VTTILLAGAIVHSVMSSDEDDLAMGEMLAVSATLSLRRARALRRSVLGMRSPRGRGGSFPGRARNVARDFDLGAMSIMRDYFGWSGRPPVYGERHFRTRFRMSTALFHQIYEALRDRPWWRQQVNATGRPQAYPLQKVFAAIRVLGYGEAYDRGDEYVRLSRSTIAVAVHKFVRFIIARFGPDYLRPPNDSELNEMLRRNAARGMPGCIGAIDCSHWQWRACPTALAGQFQNRKGRRTVVLETVCDEDTYIYHFYIGCAGSQNDLNVLKSSPLYHDIVSGAWPPRDKPFTLNGRTRTLLYYLADGIYPRFPFFATPHVRPTTRKELTYNRLQEALRKDVERLYAVLSCRFNVILRPARFETVAALRRAGMAVAILHNMNVKEHKHTYLSHERRAAGVTDQHDDADNEVNGGEQEPNDGAAAHEGAAAHDGEAAANDGAAAHDGEVDADGVLQPLAGDVPALQLLPGMQGATNAEGTLLHSLAARIQALDEDEHEMLQDDLIEHVWGQRGALLQPYVG